MTLRERPRFERIAVSGHTGVRCSHTSSLDCANASAAVVGMSIPAPSQKFTGARTVDSGQRIRQGHLMRTFVLWFRTGGLYQKTWSSCPLNIRPQSSNLRLTSQPYCVILPPYGRRRSSMRLPPRYPALVPLTDLCEPWSFRA